MTYLIAGIAVFLVTAVVFWLCLPRGGKTHRLVGTEFEPYVAVAFTACIALSFTLALSGVLELAG